MIGEAANAAEARAAARRKDYILNGNRKYRCKGNSINSFLLWPFTDLLYGQRQKPDTISKSSSERLRVIIGS